MFKKKFVFATAIATSVVLMLGTVPVSAASILKKEMKGSEVTSLQKDLKKLGYLSVDPTGYYGDLTVNAVKKLQKDYGYSADGIVGSTTFALIERMLGKDQKSTTGSGSAQVLKYGMESSTVTTLQKNLVKLGFLKATPTGYFGSATEAAVKKLQSKHGFQADGVVGSQTQALITKLLNTNSTSTAAKTEVKAATTAKAESTSTSTTDYKLPWSKAASVFARGTTATVYDIETGLSFKIKRTYGTNHADCETVSKEDTAIMKKIYGGSFSWDRRAIILTVGKTKIAASMAGMPHAGNEQYAANKTISSRSGGYGRGTNLDAVKGNNMSGHFDVHFYGSKTHGTNRSDSKHQSMVNKATEWAKKNL